MCSYMHTASFPLICSLVWERTWEQGYVCSGFAMHFRCFSSTQENQASKNKMLYESCSEMSQSLPHTTKYSWFQLDEVSIQKEGKERICRKCKTCYILFLINWNVFCTVMKLSLLYIMIVKVNCLTLHIHCMQASSKSTFMLLYCAASLSTHTSMLWCTLSYY